MVIRGVAHIFSKYSFDGVLSLRELKQLMLAESVDFVLMSEYADRFDPVTAARFIKECHNLTDGTITFIPGFKVRYKDSELLFLGVDHFVQSVGDPAHDLAEWKRGSKFVVWAHPHLAGYIFYDALKEVVDGIEVWNSRYDGVRAPRFRTLESLEMLRGRGRSVYAFAGLCFTRKEDIAGPSILLEARNDEQHILETLRNGEFVLKSRIATIHARGTIVKGNRRFLNALSLWSIYRKEAKGRIGRIVGRIKAKIRNFFKRIRRKL